MYKLLFKFSLVFSTCVICGCAGTNKESDERYIDLDGGFNTRDLGGYKTVDGKVVKKHLLYRSDDLSTLTPKGIEQAEKLRLKTIIDFRTEKEAKTATSLMHSKVENVRHLPIGFGNLTELAGLSFVADKDYEQFMIDGNRWFISNAQNQYREFFEILSDPSNAPVLYHCTAGKDRTGFATALLLSALGVDRETIYEDYLLSAIYLKPKYAHMLEDNPAIAPLITVKKSYLEAAFDEIEKNYASVENYLVQVLNVDIQKMKALYTE